MYKQIIIARKDLNMSAGKLASQVSHASMAFLTNAIRKGEKEFVYRKDEGSPPYLGYNITFEINKGIYDKWIDGVFTKVILQAKNKNQLEKVVTLANELKLKEGRDYFLIKDNCYTELEPEEIDENGVGRTLTCIGFRPLPSEIIDKIGKKYHIWEG